MTYDFLVIYVGGYLFACLVAAYVWDIKGRGAGAGFLVSLILTPVLSLLIGLALPSNKDVAIRKYGSRYEKLCPYCGEVIKKSAKICKHCHSELEE